MVNVYLVNGTVVTIPGAASADRDEIFTPGGAADSNIGGEGLVCKTADGNVVGQFKLEMVAGFTIVDEPPGSRVHPGSRRS